MSFLPYGRHTVDDDDIEAVAEVLRGDWLTTGPLVGRFEAAIAAETGAQHAVACSSGTAALHLAMIALGIGPGDAVIVPSITFLATANAVRYVGAEVVFADVDGDTGLLTPETLAQALTRVPRGLRARAAVPVHLRGLPCDMAGMAEVARGHGLDLIEDAAHALGSKYQTGDGLASVGRCDTSRMACFSFHPVKTIAMGEGGAITTNDAELVRRLRVARNHGMIRDHHHWRDASAVTSASDPSYYEMHALGFNYRVTDIQCALGLSQMRKLGSFIGRRAAIVATYDTLLDDLRPLVRPHVSRQGVEPAWHLYSALVDFEAVRITRAEVMRGLRAAGIGTQVHYIPLHRQPYYRDRYGEIDLPGSMRYYERTLSLPLYPALSDADVGRVVAELRRAMKMS